MIYHLLMANRHGEKWTAAEVCRLYYLIKSGQYTISEAEKIMGRSAKAFQYKVIHGGLFTDDLMPVKPFPTLWEFLYNLGQTWQYVPAIMPPIYKRGKLPKIFAKKARHYEGVLSIAVNKHHLIPTAGKWECKTKYKSSPGWWRFADKAQSNPFIRSCVYQREQGLCALCGNVLSEADYQAHHSDYDHTCQYRRSLSYTLTDGRSFKIPDCESCSVHKPACFEACLSRLHAVHGACNKKLNDF